MTPTNSSLASREDLQCNWHELPKFDIEPVETTEMIERRKARVEEEKVNLSSLFLHQVGRKINQYKAIFVGNNKKHMSNVASFVSVGNAAAKADPSPSVSRQHSTKRPIDPESKYYKLF